MNSNPAVQAMPLRLLVYVLAVVLAACVVSPPVYWLGSWLAEQGWLPFLQGFPFHRYFSRTIQISALVLLVPAFLWIGIRRLSQLGIERNGTWQRDLLLGLSVAILPVVLLGGAYIWLGVYNVRAEIDPARFLRILATAAAVGVMEEFLFRAVLLGLCLRAMPPWAAIGINAVVFSVIHFLRVARPAGQPDVEWWSGFEQLTRLFSSAPPWPILGWGLVSLLVAGVLLAWATWRTKSLFLAIGIHAGWVLAQQGLQWLARYAVKPPDALLPWVGPNVVSGAVPTGLAPLAILGLTSALVWLYLRREARTRHNA